MNKNRFIALVLLSMACAPAKKENMEAAIIKLGEMEGKEVKFAGLSLPANDHVAIPKNVTKRQLLGLVENYLAMNHFTLALREGKLVLTETREYESLWNHDIAFAQAKALKEDKPLFVEFEADWCEPCAAQDNLFKRDAEMIAAMKSYTLVKIDADEFRDDPDSPKGKATMAFLLEHKIDPDDIPLPLIVLVDQARHSKKIQGYQGEVGYYKVELGQFRR